MSKLGIIGSAGRRDDARRMSSDLFLQMVEKAKDVMKVLLREHDIVVDCLVSGGAALADHVAVDLLEHGYVQQLHLHLPRPGTEPTRSMPTLQPVRPPTTITASSASGWAGRPSVL